MIHSAPLFLSPHSFWLILAERLLRQLVATPLLGRGHSFHSWVVAQSASPQRGMFCIRLLLLMSGVTISFWNCALTGSCCCLLLLLLLG